MGHLEAIGNLCNRRPDPARAAVGAETHRKGQNQMLRKINKIDKHKVSYKVCDHHRGNCGGCSRNH